MIETQIQKEPKPIDASFDVADPTAAANSLCPVCGEKLRFVRCEGICRSTACVYRVVLTCTDS